MFKFIFVVLHWTFFLVVPMSTIYLAYLIIDLIYYLNRLEGQNREAARANEAGQNGDGDQEADGAAGAVGAGARDAGNPGVDDIESD
uniref:Uncharacterized protein n=1 Tax=Caenorhabditis tropicalis TaxID=1561998 RepID=A0A1I7TBQ9_9PELO